MTWLHAVIDVPADQHRRLADYWSRALGWTVGDPWPGHPELRSFTPRRGASYIHVQEIEGPPRVHLDVESVDPDATVRRAGELGGSLIRQSDRWQTLLSPGGLPFCVLRVGEHIAPQPTTWQDGHRSRLVQISIDSPAAAHDREVDFWRVLLPGRWAESPAAEFAGKWHDDDGSPLQLLFQRLDEPVGPVRAHLDLGTDDLSAAVRRLERLGARDVGPGRGWHTLLDPGGLAFCATENSPEQVRHRDLG